MKHKIIRVLYWTSAMHVTLQVCVWTCHVILTTIDVTSTVSQPGLNEQSKYETLQTHDEGMTSNMISED